MHAESQPTAKEYMCTKFGVDSSSHFPVRAWTNRQTDKQTEAPERNTHTSHYAGMGNK